jgi:hypothetical protein
MDHDDDVEHLFSWLQTPELRYREFAGAREITDNIVTWQVQTNTAEAVRAETPTPGNVQLEEEYPADQFPDQVASKVEIAPAPHSPSQGPAMVAPEPLPASSTAVPPPAPVAPPSQHASAGLLGGAYSEDEAHGGSATPPQPAVTPTGGTSGGGRSLDAVFGRLGGRLPDPRDRARLPNPPAGRPR